MGSSDSIKNLSGNWCFLCLWKTYLANNGFLGCINLDRIEDICGI